MKAFPTYEHKGRIFSLPYHLPEGKSGKFSVSVEFKAAGTRLPVVSMRNALFMGLKATVLTLDEPIGVHTLKESGAGTWMSSLPQEVEQHTRQLAKMRGKVLVGGLGLGLAVGLLDRNPNVAKVVVVERSKDVIKLVGAHLPKGKVSVIQADIYQYLHHARNFGVEFNSVFLDTWCPTGERVLEEDVMPLRRLCQGIVPNHRIECWNEDEMIGQVKMGCQTALGGYLATDLPQDSPFKAWTACDDDTFHRNKRGIGVSWYYVHWLRTVRPKAEAALQGLEAFVRACKDPAEFDTWVAGGPVR